MKNARYVLFNVLTHRAVTYGDDFGDICVEARRCHSITGEPYRVYDTQAQRDVYWWPVEGGKTVCAE